MMHTRLLFCFGFICVVFAQTPTIKNAQLDLKAWNPVEEPILHLTGDWKFYWKSFVLTQDSTQTYQLAPVPKAWNRYNVQPPIPTDGYATYQLTFHNVPEEKVGMRLRYIRGAYAVYVDSVLIFTKGKIGKSKEEYTFSAGTEYVYFIPPSSTFTLSIHVANFDHYNSGILKLFPFGLYKDIRELHTKNAILDICVFACLFSLGIYHLILFLIRRKEWETFYFFAFCFIGMVRTIVLNERLIFYFFPDISPFFVELVNIGSYYFGVLVFMYFLDSMFPGVYPKRFKQLATATYLGLTFICCLGNIRWAYFFQFPTHIITVGFIGFTFYYYGKVFQLVKPFFIGLSLITLFFIHDVLVAVHVLNSQMIFPYGLLAFFLFYAIIIARRYQKAFETNKQLYKTISSINDQLEEQNIILEEIVEERTAQLVKEKEKAEQHAESKSRFLMFMTHELRTPINAIIGYSELIQEDMEDEDDTPEYLDDIKRIRVAGHHLLSVVNNVLDLSKVEAGMLELHIEEFPIEKLLSDVQGTIRPLIAEKNNTLTISNKFEKSILRNDFTKIKQVLINLLGNAAKFTTNGDIRLIVKSEGDMLWMYVIDNGIGMSEEQLSRLFFEFEQGNSSIQKNYGGSGLGLILSKKIIEAMSGTISVQSTYGQGSTFIVTFPISLNR